MARNTGTKRKESVTLRLTCDVRRVLRMEAARRGISQSVLMEAAIRKMLKLAA